ncbi:MAG: OsmC family protein [Treponemataceae bacterium]
MGDVKHIQIRWVQGKEFEATTESGHRVITDAREEFGGKNHGPSPMELLLVCLGNCTGISVADILLKKRQNLTAFELRVDGVGSDTHPKVYTDIEIVYVVHGRDISPKAVEDAIQLSKEKYCGISEMLGKTAKLTTRFEIVAD